MLLIFFFLPPPLSGVWGHVLLKSENLENRDGFLSDRRVFISVLTRLIPISLTRNWSQHHVLRILQPPSPVVSLHSSWQFLVCLVNAQKPVFQANKPHLFITPNRGSSKSPLNSQHQDCSPSFLPATPLPQFSMCQAVPASFRRVLWVTPEFRMLSLL